MNRPAAPFSLLLALALLGSIPAAPAADPSTIARSGAPGLAPCASCHGAAGEGQGSFPRLAGLDGAYLARQLDDFASGRRASTVMTPIAKALSPADRRGLAGHYARLRATGTTGGAEDPDGRRLALEGAWSRGVPACVQCHGPDGRGVGAAFPALAGQTAGYISAQLRAFRSGQRNNDPLQLMRAPASKLTDQEIDAVARWFATRPGLRTGGRP
ncbi:c-type cytochrome [Lysobacter sp. N42]|jgi:cytochrome c553|uniref:c-type cytochrome n=1 Tax=Lysobacter sp. N42 TaxID=2545719 RepID=UPI001044D21A|nr:c-type cytochrome [Lysobacter sp. N42]TCZ83362.1 c-type cytochrome [Lysobacter sp. N42]